MMTMKWAEEREKQRGQRTEAGGRLVMSEGKERIPEELRQGGRRISDQCRSSGKLVPPPSERPSCTFSLS